MKGFIYYLVLLVLYTTNSTSSAQSSSENTNAAIDNPAFSSHPTNVNQKFFTTFGKGDTLTVRSFFGASGLEYSTYEEAVWNNEADGMILIKNVEHGGASEWKHSILLGGQHVDKPFPPLHENYGANQSLLKSVWKHITTKHYQRVIEKGATEKLIKMETLVEIGEILDSQPKISWKLIMKRVNKDVVEYNLFAFPPRFYGDPAFPPFIEIATSVDNSKNPNKLNSFYLKLGQEIDMDKFEEIGISPEYIR